MAPKLVAIHQPNFFPWLGYFNKMARADVFVLLDDAQFPKKGGTWINRVKLLVNGEPSWATVPVVRSYHGNRSIREMKIEEQKPWRRKLLATLESSYGRAPAYDQVMPLIADRVNNPTDDLADYNRASIEALSGALGLNPRIVWSSSLEVDAQATDRLIELVRAVGGDAYLCGTGASAYQEDEKFAAAGLELVHQRFKHPSYPQSVSPPVAGLSIIDTLMNCGLDGTRDLITG